MTDTSDPYSAFEQHQWVGCVTCCLSAEITQGSQGLGFFPLCCSREFAGTTECCSLLFNTGPRRGLLSELGTPEQGGWLQESPVPPTQSKTSFLCGALVALLQGSVSTTDILTLEVRGARQQWMQDSAASCFLHAWDGVAKAGSFFYEVLEVMPPVQASASPQILLPYFY